MPLSLFPQEFTNIPNVSGDIYQLFSGNQSELDWTGHLLKGGTWYIGAAVPNSGIATKKYVDDSVAGVSGSGSGITLHNISDENGWLLDTSGDTLYSWLEGYLYASDLTDSIHVFDRQLFNSTNQTVLDWQNRGLSGLWKVQSPTGQSGIANKGYVDNGLANILKLQNIDGSFGQLYYEGTSDPSIDFFNSQLFDTGTLVSINYQDRVAIDGLGNTAINWNDGTLANTGQISVNWASGWLIASNATIAYDWFNGLLNDASGNNSIDTAFRNLITSAGDVNLDWENYLLNGNWFVNTPILAGHIANKSYVDSVVTNATTARIQYVGDADTAISGGTDIGFVNEVWTVNRTITLPPANTYPSGGKFTLLDVNGNKQYRSTTFARTGTDLIVFQDGGNSPQTTSSASLPPAGPEFVWYSDGSGRWSSPAVGTIFGVRVATETLTYQGQGYINLIGGAARIYSDSIRGGASSWMLGWSAQTNMQIDSNIDNAIGWERSGMLAVNLSGITGIYGDLKVRNLVIASGGSISGYATIAYVDNISGILNTKINLITGGGGTGLPNVDGVDGKLLYTGTINTSFDWQNGVIYDPASTGSFPVIDVAARNLNALLPADAGYVTTVDWQNQFLLNTDGSASVDWEQQFLYTFDGVLIADWNQGVLFYPVGGFYSINWQNGQAFSSEGAQSINWNVRRLYDSAANQKMDWETGMLTAGGTNDHSVDWVNRRLMHGSGVAVLDWFNMVISDGTQPSIDWNNRNIYDGGGFFSIQYGNRALLDSANVTGVDWGNRFLFNAAGDLMLDWDGRSIYNFWNVATPTASDSSFIANVEFVTGQISGALAGFTGGGGGSGGMTPNVNGNLFRLLYPSGSGTFTLSWDSGILWDLDGDASVNWLNRVLYANDGITVTADWNLQQLYGNWNAITPASPTHIANKQYVDDKTANINVGDGTLRRGDDSVSVGWFASQLIGEDGQPSIDWEGRKLKNLGGQDTLNYDQRILTGEWHVTQLPIVDSGIANKLYVDRLIPTGKRYIWQSNGDVNVDTNSPTSVMALGGAYTGNGFGTTVIPSGLWAIGTKVKVQSNYLYTSTDTESNNATFDLYFNTGILVSENIFGLPTGSTISLQVDSHIICRDIITGSGFKSGLFYIYNHVTPSYSLGQAAGLTINPGDPSSGYFDISTDAQIDIIVTLVSGDASGTLKCFQTLIERENLVNNNVPNMDGFLSTAYYSGTLIPSIDWTNALLKDNNGTQALGWVSNRYLLDFAGNGALDWGNRLMLDSAFIAALDWENKALLTKWTVDTPTGDIPSQIANVEYVAESTSNGVFPGFFPRATYPRCFSTGSVSGDNDLYTVPSGRKALVSDFIITNSTTGNINYYPILKISGVSFRIGSNKTENSAGIGHNYSMTNNQGSMPIVLNEGETISINTSTSGLTIWPSVVEFDANAPLSRADITGWVAGDNILLTVPDGKTLCLSAMGLQFANNPAPAHSAILYANETSATRTMGGIYIVPSGATSDVTNRFAGTNTVFNHGVFQKYFHGNLGGGDFIVINSDSGISGQFAWTNYIFA